jgi:ComF family protein
MVTVGWPSALRGPWLRHPWLRHPSLRLAAVQGPALPIPAPGLKRLAVTALDLLLPPRSLDGADSGPASVHWPGLTPAAWSKIAFIEAPACDGCGAAFEYDLGEGARCAACLRAPAAFDRARAACVYDEHVRGLILGFKHGDRTDLAALFARWIARSAADILPTVDAVVPVPLHRWRLLKRRYNQAAEIARPLARRAGIAYLPQALARTRATPVQGHRGAEDRRRNVEGAFVVPPASRRRLEGRRLLLIDDVLTTGATLEGCALALKAAGAASVDVAVIARVGPLTTPAL